MTIPKSFPVHQKKTWFFLDVLRPRLMLVTLRNGQRQGLVNNLNSGWRLVGSLPCAQEWWRNIDRTYRCALVRFLRCLMLYIMIFLLRTSIFESGTHPSMWFGIFLQLWLELDGIWTSGKLWRHYRGQHWHGNNRWKDCVICYLWLMILMKDCNKQWKFWNCHHGIMTSIANWETQEWPFVVEELLRRM